MGTFVGTMLTLKIFLLAFVILILSVAGIGIKMFIKKDGEFKKACSTIDPKTGQPLGCSCGGGGEGTCRNEEGSSASGH